jgi:tripartite-type tricarboxylate transporter receptor subunit TctC
MKLPRRAFLRIAGASAALPLLPRIAKSQDWPTRVVRLLVGFPPGGGADSATRILANRLSEMWGQQVVVEIRPGAGGNIALDATAHAAADGYTMVVAVTAPAIYGFLFRSLSYDPVADFAPVTLVGMYPNILAVPNDSRFKSFSDYLAEAKANPGKVNFASPGVGTSAHLSGELLKRMAGINITHVPYRGVAAGAMSDLMTGRIDAMFNTTGSLLQAVRSGQVRALAVTSGERFPLAAELPTIAESGVPGYDVTSFYAVYARAGTPAPILEKMHADITAMLREPAVKARYEALGVIARPSTPAELAAKARVDAELWGPVIKAANIRAD